MYIIEQNTPHVITSKPRNVDLVELERAFAAELGMVPRKNFLALNRSILEHLGQVVPQGAFRSIMGVLPTQIRKKLTSSCTKRFKHLDEIVDAMLQQEGAKHNPLLSTEIQILNAIKAFFAVLCKYLNLDELPDLPPHLKREIEMLNA